MQKASTATFLPILAALAYEYAADAAMRGFIADLALPIFETPIATAEYPVIPSEAFMKLYETKRAPRTKYNSSDYEFKSGQFACSEYGWEELIDDSERALYANLFDAQEVAMKRAVDIILRKREKRVADKLFNVSNFSNDAVSVPWNALEAADPRADIKAKKLVMRNAIGMLPNAAIISWTRFQDAISCKKFLEHIKYTDPVLTKDEEYQKQLLARYLGVDQVLVGNAVYDAAAKGQDSAPSDVWGNDYCLLARIAQNPRDLREPCVGRTFLWTADSPLLLTTETYRSESNRSDVLRVRNNIDERFVFQACGYLLTGLSGE